MIALYILAGAVALPLLARFVIDRLALRFRWRIGKLSQVLPGWKYGGCLRCRTSFRYVTPHDTPYEYTDRATGTRVKRDCFPLCDPCWQELGAPAARAAYYELLWERWQEERARQQLPPRDITDLVSIRASILAGL